MDNALKQYDKLIQTVDWLAQRDLPVSITLTEFLESSGGHGAIIFPPTYARKGGKHPYAIDDLRTDIPPETASTNEEVNICCLDSVGSQANRMEVCFTQQPFSGFVPQFTISADGENVNLLAVGHRIADGAVRFSGLADAAKEAITALKDSANAQKIARIAPTSLVFGFWDSRDSRYKSARILSSVIYATNVAPLKRSAQFTPAFDPSTIGLEVEAAVTEPQVETIEEIEKHPLAQIGLRAVPAVDKHGGVRIYGRIVRQTEINLVNLRALVVAKDGGIDEPETLKLRRYILGLCLIAGRSQPNYNLRQGCLLVMKDDSNPKAQLVYPSGKRDAFTWDLKTSFDFAKTTADEFKVDAGGEHAFMKSKVDAKLKEKEQEKAEKKSKKRAVKV
jgi:CRISPR-associated protein Csb1